MALLRKRTAAMFSPLVLFSWPKGTAKLSPTAMLGKGYLKGRPSVGGGGGRSLLISMFI
jgi:hypothetical protein